MIQTVKGFLQVTKYATN